LERILSKTTPLSPLTQCWSYCKNIVPLEESIKANLKSHQTNIVGGGRGRRRGRGKGGEEGQGIWKERAEEGGRRSSGTIDVIFLVI
jgi:hypothetical protein